MEFKKISNIIVKCLKDKKYKEEFKKNPKAVFEKECNTKLPGEVQLKVIEDTPTVKHVVIPYTEAGELSDKELEALAGGDLLLSKETVPLTELRGPEGMAYREGGPEGMAYRERK